MNTANIYAGIVKMDDNGDGTLTVYGKATDDTLDIDQQICDPVWLDKAMPEWFMTGGNIREQHSNIAAGVAEEYEKKSDGHYITALVVDPVSVKKVKTRVLKGFSIGIKSPRVVRDTKAVNGRIVDGQIVEVSLVDRPANPNAKLVLAKSAAGQEALVKTEEYVEKHGDHDQSDHNPHGSGGGSSESSSGGIGTRHVDVTRDAIVDARQSIALQMDKINLNNHPEDERDGAMREARGIQSEINSHLDDANTALNAARNEGDYEAHIGHLEDALDSLNEAADLADDSTELSSTFRSISSTLAETADALNGRITVLMDESEDESDDEKSASGQIKNKEQVMARNTRVRKSALKKEAEGMPMNGDAKAVPSRDEMVERYASARKALDEVTRMCKEYGYSDIEKQYGETAEEETSEGSYPNAAEQEVSEARGEKPLDKELVAEDGEEEMKSATNKCLECGCDQPANSHGSANVSTAVMVTPDQTPVPTPAIQPPTPKSATTILPLPVVETVGTQIDEEEDSADDSAEKSLLADVNLTDIVEKAVKSAIASVEARVAELKSAKEAVENKLETELATAKSLAIGGGPKRTTMATGAKTTNEWRAKADLYFAKAANTTDNDLAKGYREMAKDFLAKSQSEVKA